MSVHLLEQGFQPYQWLSEFETQLPSGQHGASASFIGTMRDFNDNESIQHMTLEHYPAMTQRYLEQLEQRAEQQWPLNACLIVHRFGDIHIGDSIVLIGCWSAHRRAALDACAWLIEELKFNAPFWKKEYRQHGTVWVSENTSGN
ncbi:Molybdenum cofactor biosynthesis protein MoaE [Methylophaga frappieri]|uniref:Molybdopterin synthase catalytic subunit n=1 Tax=Methylophaga frappieri (strain ATCC BAA-2434 / DSM 25690 / JAM7) TaxID=754477 RepID=I1YI69_METFJ|nr:molybdenum cofactor biosynthesis protein MoaE [Methylophaga frappieri]AFJ02612.1 Molybdenum cofactor biosynthesis protein MoaE [Methylophaga frappieri]